MRDDPPIFVTGLGRSGTSLLRGMLNAHPELYLAQEASFHSWSRPFRRSHTPRDRLRAWFGSFSFAWMRLDPNELTEGLPAELVDEHLDLVYERSLRALAKRNGAMRWGEKNPFLVNFLDAIYGRWPDARVVFMVRDPRATALSQTRMPWSCGALSVVVHLLRLQLQKVEAHRDAMLFVRLEDLLSEPEQTMRRVLDFTGLEWSDRVLEHARHVPSDDGIPFPWLQSADRRRGAASASWATELSPAWIRLIESVDHRILADFGYEAARLEREPRFGVGTLEVLRDIPETLRFLWRILGTVRRYRGQAYPSAGEGQRLLNSYNPSAWTRRPEWVLEEPPDVPDWR